MTAAQWALLALLSTLWGGSFFFYKKLVPVLPPFTIVLARVSISAVALALLVWARGETLRFPPRTWMALGVLGLTNNAVPFVLVAYGEIYISSGVASILNATTPLFTALVAHAFTTTDRLTWSRMIGVVLGLAGVGVLIGRDALGGVTNANLLGQVACVLAAVSYGIAGVYGLRFNNVPPLQVATGQMITATIVLLPSVFFDRPWTLPSPDLATWAALLGLSFASTAFAFVVYFQLLARVGATNASLVTFLVPISALLLGVLVLDEEMAATALAGMAIIAAGLVFIDGRLLRRWRRPATSSVS